MNTITFFSWPTILGLSILSLVLGIIGYQLYDPTLSILSSIYCSIQLFTLEGNFDKDIPIPIPLDIARFLAPAILAGAIYRLTLNYFSKISNQFIVKYFYRNHVVFCGLNSSSAYLIKDYLKNGEKVVLIEKDFGNSMLSIFKKTRLKIIIGNPENPVDLNKTKIQFAKTIFALTESDTVNSNIGEQVIQLQKLTRMHNKIKIILHLYDLPTIQVFKDFQENNQNPNHQIHLFNLKNRIAMSVVEMFSPDQFVRLKSPDDPPAHIIIHGFNEMGKHLMIEMLKLYHFGNLQKIRITVVDSNPERKLREFEAAYPSFGEIADVNWLSNSGFWTSSYNQEFLDANLLFITTDSDAENVQVATRYRQLFVNKRISNPGESPVSFEHIISIPKIVILMTDEPDLFDLSRNLEQKLKKTNIDVVNIRKQLLTKKAIGDDIDIIDDLARVINESYNKQTQKATPWELLTDQLKDSNRFAARHLSIKLRYLDFEIMHKGHNGIEVDLSNIPIDQVKVLSQMEHNRWMAFSLLMGFTGCETLADTDLQNAIKKNIKLHKDIVCFDRLEILEKNKDMLMQDFLPGFIEKKGQGLYKRT